MRVSRSRLAGRSVTGAPLVALLAALLIPAAARAQQVAIVTVPQGTNQPYLKLVDPLSAAASPDHLMTRFMIGVATASPDGKTVAYVGSTGAEYLLRRQDTSGGAPQGGFANCFQP